MYFKKLYQHNKFWLFIVAAFCIIQLYLTIRQDISVSPFYYYGMFSEKIFPQKNYTVTEIFVDDKKLQTKNFSPQQWDKIVLPVQLFADQQQWNSYWFNNDIKRLLHISDSSKYINHNTDTDFNTWYKKYLQTIIHQKLDSLAVQQNIYFFNGTNFIKQ